MTDQEENQNIEPDYKKFTNNDLNRILAILFVLGIYVLIFLKILFIE